MKKNDRQPFTAYAISENGEKKIIEAETILICIDEHHEVKIPLMQEHPLPGTFTLNTGSEYNHSYFRIHPAAINWLHIEVMNGNNKD
ncbi:hypothetical protein [Chryseobacterium sp.]|uniref:hypothetical protein n=1 Tax=Chryseobacterium sp. TaxID=1871047 RepID=UPI0025BABCC8|nr:hypothetical protein [Chryseobacterium sp.]MBV8325181.1 hypothetical protein [Chryseobacterium sp.]